MCLVLPRLTGLPTSAKAPCESERTIILIGGPFGSTKPNSPMRWIRKTASDAALEHSTYSDSTMDLATEDYFLKRQLMAPPWRMKTCPPVDRPSVMSPAKEASHQPTGMSSSRVGLKAVARGVISSMYPAVDET